MYSKMGVGGLELRIPRGAGQATSGGLSTLNNHFQGHIRNKKKSGTLQTRGLEKQKTKTKNPQKKKTTPKQPPKKERPKRHPASLSSGFRQGIKGGGEEAVA